MSEIDKLVENNRRFAESFEMGDVPIPPRKKVAIVTCMDARILMHRMLGLYEGDAHIIRNAGGGVNDDVIRSLCVSQWLLGTEEIMLIHHTNCGMHTSIAHNLKETIEENVGIYPTFPMETFDNAEDDLKHCMQILKECPVLAHKDHIRGFVYDVTTGRIAEVFI